MATSSTSAASHSDPTSVLNQPLPQAQHSFSIKLTSANYLTWKSQFLPLLNCYSLQPFVDDAAQHPTPSDSTYGDWFRKDQLLLSWLLSSLSEDVFPLVVGLQSSREVWSALRAAFGSVSYSRQLQIYRELQTLRQEDKSVADYLKRAKQLKDALSSAGRVLSDSEFNTIIFHGLDEAFSSVVTALTISDQQPSYYTLLGHLSAHEIMIQSRQPPALQPSVNMASSNASQQRSMSFTAPSQHTSHDGRHPGRDGRSNNSSNTRNNNTSNRGKQNCQIFGKSNHSARTCFRGPEHFRLQLNNAQVNHVQATTVPVQTTPLASWYPDTGATHHVTSDLANLTMSNEYNGNIPLRVGDGVGLKITHMGTSVIRSSSRPFYMTNALCVPTITKNLLSVQQFCKDNNCFFEFHANFFVVKDRNTKNILLRGRTEDGLYKLLTSSAPTAAVAHLSSFSDWHARLGHPASITVSNILSSNNLRTSTSKLDSQKCSSCCYGKLSKIPLHLTHSISNSTFDLVHMDVWGPSPILSSLGSRYFLVIIDDCTRFSWFFPLKLKSDVYSVFLNFQRLIHHQFDKNIKVVQTDWGGEFRALQNYFKQQGILHRITCPHTHEQNGTSESKIRHIVDTGLTLLSHAMVPLRFWEFAFETAVFLINRMPTRILKNISPLQKLFGRISDYSFLKIFDCAIYPYMRPFNKHIFSFRTQQCIFLGYSPSHYGYRCYNPVTDKITMARHVQFDELIFPFSKISTAAVQPPLATPAPWLTLQNTFDPPVVQPPPSKVTSPTTQVSPNPSPSSNSQQPSNLANLTEPLNELVVDLTNYNTNSAQPNSDPIQVPIRTHPMTLRTNHKPKTYLATKYPLPSALLVSKTDIEPTCFSDANKFVHWRQAMSDEVNALIRNGTWTLMPKPQGANVVGNKWVFRIKRKPDGSLDRYKARLVAKGYHQHDGIDYTDTFSPVVKATTIRIVLSLAISCNWTLKQLDVSNAFLHGNLSEEVYMSQPPGFVDENHPDYVCRLHKSLYGLKQAPREWFRRLSTYVCSLGFIGSTTDPSLFIYSVDSVRIFLLVYVDDIILTGNCPHSLSHFQAALQKEFNVRDLGDLHYFLGIEVTRTSDGLYLSQRKYLADLLTRTHMDGAKPVRSPMTLESLSKTTGSPLLNPESYRQTLGALQYATLTRPDLAFCVNKLCQFMHSPTDVHWDALKRVLRYIKGTLDLSLWYQQNSTITLNCYSDADWAGCPDDRKSTSGYLIFLGSNLISWCARKQPTPARSSTESEYRAVANATAELIWIRSLLNELGITQSSPPVLWCDNIGATYLSANPLFKARTKHIEVDFHFVRDQVSKRLLSVQYVSTKDQLADLLTKPLPSPRFRFLLSKLHLRDRPSACGGMSTPLISPIITHQQSHQIPNSPPKSSPTTSSIISHQQSHQIPNSPPKSSPTTSPIH